MVLLAENTLQVTTLQYPAPRYPTLVRPKSVEELVTKVKILATGPEWELQADIYNGGWGIRPKDKVLLAVRSDSHPWVVDAAVRAIREQGARVDVFSVDYSAMGDPYTNAAQEVLAMDQLPDNINDDYNYYYTGITNILRTSTVTFLVEKEKYTKVISGMAGIRPEVRYPWLRYNYSSLEEFQTGSIEFPFELQKLIDNKVWEQIRSIERARLTDPEGTDITFTNYDDKRPQVYGHEFCKPIHIGFGGVEDSRGIISGTTNHLGAFPNIRAYIKDGLVVKVEGGGIYGEEWQKRIEKFENVTLPPRKTGTGWGAPKVSWPSPGFFWWNEMALGTNPLQLRLPGHGRFTSFASQLEERKRSGIIHNGFGASIFGWAECVKEGLPWIHCHIHCLFPTLEGTTKNGDSVTVVDKGHLLALDDPQVRTLARKYGDPDKLLSEIWLPSIPGINAKGDYMRDYGRDPVSWIGREAKEHPFFPQEVE